MITSQWIFPPLLFVKISETFCRNVPWIKISGVKNMCMSIPDNVFKKLSEFILLPIVNEINSFPSLLTNLGITPIWGVVTSNFLYKKVRTHYCFRNHLSVLPHNVYLCVRLGPWLVIYPAAKCHPAFSFRCPLPHLQDPGMRWDNSKRPLCSFHRH